ncbi:MAG: serine hydrolase [Bacteroidetes bacterium]|nr:serine hydrolase [Bacteroidota bacterium]
MKKQAVKAILVLFLGFYSFLGKAQSLYFPPSFSSTWDTIQPSTLGWCQSKVDTLTNYVGNTNAKAFIVLKNGKIVIEKYYGTFTADSLWFWASAGKSLAAVMIGRAEQDGIINLNDSTSKYLGSGWSDCTPQQEKLITVKDQLKMTSGLNDALSDPDCTVDTCLQYLANAGTRWAYHNAPYHLLHDVLENASGLTLQQYTNQKIKTPIGMGTGFWFDHVFYSRARDMARFGLLALANGNWNGNMVVNNPTFINDMKNTSNPYNLSYGYLWWLNGKSSCMVPQSQLVFPMSLIPNAPADMYCALGKYDQKIYVVPSQNLVVIRMGNAATTAALALSAYDNVLWEKISDLTCSVGLKEDEKQSLSLYPNPANKIIYLEGIDFTKNKSIVIIDLLGKETKLNLTQVHTNKAQIDISNLPKGIYFLQIDTFIKKLIID